MILQFDALIQITSTGSDQLRLTNAFCYDDARSTENITMVHI